MTADAISLSIIVPCYRAEEVLEAGLAALARQAGDHVYEVIVVDNGGSEGGLAAAIANFPETPARLRVVEEPVPGSYAARNAGVAAAGGAILAFTDADCRPDPDWLSSLVEGLGRPGVLAAGTEIVAAGQAGLVARYAERAGILSQRHALGHERGPFLQTASLAVSRERVDAVSGFDVSLPTGGDADFCWRLQEREPDGRFVLADGGLVRHHHRETVGGLYRQFRRYGQADVIFARRGGARPGRELLRLLLDGARLLLAPLLAVLSLPLALVRGDALPVVAPLLRAVRVLGRRAGRLRARLRPGDLHRA